MTKSVILVLFGFLAVLSTVLALECYECTNCVIPFEVTDDTPKKDCGDGSCMKVNVTLKDTVIVSRGCSLDKVQEERCNSREEAGSVTEHCFCNDDACNTAAHKTMTSSLYVACCIFIFITVAIFGHL